MNSRIIVVIGLTLLTAFNSYAQVDPNTSLHEHKMAKYKDMKDGGLAMTVIGGILIIVGGAIELNNVGDIFSTEPEKDNSNIGPVLFCSGAVLAGAGIPLTIIGTKKYRYYKRNPDAITLGISSRPGSTGLSLKYRF